MLTKESTYELNNKVEIPILGLGTWRLSGEEAVQAVLWAIEEGYRLIDTAALYGNEKKIGEAIAQSPIPREELFITTKVWDSDHGYKKTLKAFDRSLKKLDLEFVDLYLIHWPATSKRDETWKALEKIYEEGRAKAIGVSNYTIRHLKELLEVSEVVPAVNQVEFSPFLYQQDLLEFCRSKDIYLEAYSPLTKGKKLSNPALIQMAEKYNKSPAQIMLRWAIQHKVIVIPKSGSKQHLKENIDLFDFEIATDDMNTLDDLDKNYRTVTDPATYD